jgi:hypothetical protein
VAEWLVRQGSGKPIGPVSTELVIRGIEAGKIAISAEVCRVGTSDWLPLDMVDEFSDVAYDDDAATRVTDSPWFMDHQSQSRRAGPDPRAGSPVHAPKVSGLGLPPAPPPIASSPRPGPASRRAAPAPPVRRPPPQPQRAAPPQPSPASNAYTADDDAKTRVAGAPSEAGQSSYEFDDETMTRVAAARVPDQPIGIAPKNTGLLKTAPMWSADLPDAALPRKPSEITRHPAPTPRPAAGARPEASIQVRADLMAPVPAMPPPPPGFARAEPAFPPARPAAADHSAFGPTMPAGPAPPPAYAREQAPPQPPAYGQPPAYAQRPAAYYVPPPPPEPRGDGGVKALIALIVVLGLALMVILILLVLRR